MHEYHVFFGDSYYPGGGMRDYVGSFKTREDAVNCLLRETWDWADIAVTNKDGTLSLIDRFTKPSVR